MLALEVLTMSEFETTLPENGQEAIPQKDRLETEVEVVKISRAPSRLLPGYGAIRPYSKPEDFRAVRAAFEQGVAEEVLSKR